MLSYQHSYHAGNFADVIKHVILTRLLGYLTQKEKPLVYIDTHAGRGRYDLKDRYALKTNEAQLGIQLLWENRQQLSPLFKAYIETITQLNNNNNNNNLRYYSGSPEIAIQLLRKEDRLILCELHPTEFSHLERLPSQKKRISCQKTDGLNSLHALLPPIERRGLVFVDPSYEQKTEYQEVTRAIKVAYKRFSTGTYCIWYPFINKRLHDQFLHGLETIDKQNSLRLEFYINKNSSDQRMGMTGSGLWIINPPYTLAEEGKNILQELTQIIQPDSSSFIVEA